MSQDEQLQAGAAKPSGDGIGATSFAADPHPDGESAERQQRVRADLPDGPPIPGDNGASMDPYAPARVQEIFQNMVAHRQRVVRQIAGVPAAAMRAAIAQGHTILDRDDPINRDPDQSGLVAWLERKANSNFLAGVVWSMTPWGRQQTEREFIRQIDTRLADQALLMAQHHIGNQALDMTDADRQFLDEQDKALLGFLAGQGHIPSMPEVVNSYTGTDGQGPGAFSFPGIKGEVRMRGDRKGDYFGMLPSASEHIRNPAQQNKTFGQRIGEYARGLEQGKAPEAVTDHHHQIYSRWFTLLHEVAHTQFSNIKAPFRPTPGKVNPAQAQAVNRWITGPFSMGSLAGYGVLSENHSDVVGAMLVLEATGYDPKAMEALQVFSQDRRRVREAGDIENQEKLEYRGSVGGNLACVHATDWALERVMDNMAEWAGKSPAQMRELALGYASDGFLSFVDPDREMTDGRKIGRTVADAIIAPEPCAWSGTRGLTLMAMMQAEGIDPIAKLQEIDLDPTVARLMHSAWRVAGPKIREILAQPGATEDFMACNEPVTGWILEAINDPMLPTNNHGHRDYQAVIQAYKRDIPLLYQAFGLEPPQMDEGLAGQALQRWRDVRYRKPEFVENKHYNPGPA